MQIFGGEKMKNTIKAKNGYTVKQLKSNPNTVRLYDGDNFIFDGTLRTYEDYIEECVNGGDETAVKCEVFTTIKGNQFIYWISKEYGEDYLTKIEN